MWKRFYTCVFLLLCASAYGANNYWLDGSGLWTNGANWSLGISPAGGDVPILTNNGTVVRTWTGSDTNWGLVVTRGTNIFDFGGFTHYGTNTSHLFTNQNFNGIVAIITNGTLSADIGNSPNFGWNSSGSSSNSLMVISNGGQLFVSNISWCTAAGAHNSRIVVGDRGTFTCRRAVTLGVNSSTNLQIYVGGLGAVFSNGFSTMLVQQGTSNFTFTVESNGFYYCGGQTALNGASNQFIGRGSVTNRFGGLNFTGIGNLLTLSNGVFALNTAGSSTISGHDHFLLVSGAGTILSNISASVTFALGYNGTNCTLMVSNGAYFAYEGNSVGCNLGANNSGSSNRFIVTGPGSTGWYASLLIGTVTNTHFNELIVRNGGFAGLRSAGTSPLFAISSLTNSTGNRVIVSGAGSVAYGNGVLLGTNGYGNSWGMVLMDSGGTLSLSNSIVIGPNANNVLTNNGGILEWRNRTPTITTNYPNTMIFTNGTMAFSGRLNPGVTNVDIYQSAVSNFVYQGTSNSIRLDSSSNLLSQGHLTFSPANGLYFNHLEIVNDGSRWSSTATTLGPGGVLTISNTGLAMMTGTLTNNGGLIRHFGTTFNFTNGMVLADSSTLNLCPAGVGSVTFSNLIHSSGTLTVNNWTGTGGSSGTGCKIYSVVNPGATMLNAIQFTGYSAGATYIAAGEVVPPAGAPSVVITNLAPLLLIFD